MCNLWKFIFILAAVCCVLKNNFLKSVFEKFLRIIFNYTYKIHNISNWESALFKVKKFKKYNVGENHAIKSDDFI